jgi:hypothetical protein
MLFEELNLCFKISHLMNTKLCTYIYIGMCAFLNAGALPWHFF